MAQTLKEELRNNIINSSRNEFLNNGFINASMRNIADSAGMTVGNLYRYYKSKEELYDAIVKDCRKEIEILFADTSNIHIEKQTRVYDVRFDVNDIRREVDDFKEKLVDIYIRFPSEFLMLINEDETKEKITSEFRKLILKIIRQNYAVDMFEKEVNLLACSYSCAVYSGMKRIFNSEFDANKINDIFRIFLRGFVAILDEDIAKLVN